VGLGVAILAPTLALAFLLVRLRGAAQGDLRAEARSALPAWAGGRKQKLGYCCSLPDFRSTAALRPWSLQGD
jgi:hypothetical protein